MKRFHIHVSVDDLAKSIGFYSTLFGSKPTRVEADYAKWMIEDPRMNFAISTGRQPVGVNHLGFQVDSSDELRGMHGLLAAADAHVIEENERACCYRRVEDAPWMVAAWIGAAYWFTASTSFANLAITIARSQANTFSGIRPVDAPWFIVAPLAGALVALGTATVLFAKPRAQDHPIG